MVCFLFSFAFLLTFCELFICCILFANLRICAIALLCVVNASSDARPSSTDITTDNPMSTSDEGSGICPNVNNAIDCIKDRNCVDCTPWGCRKCADGYWLFEYYLACQACSNIDNCDTCSTWVGCEICDPDYTITWVQQCPLLQGGVTIIATCV